MRTAPLALMLACTGAVPDDSGAPVAPSWDYPLDDTLRITHGQAIGTHNSYHVAPEDPLVAEWDYTHAPLDVQARDQGVRQLEIDVWRGEDDGPIEVLHVPYADYGTTCPTLAECLDTLLQWSQANPAHFPLVVLVEPKDEVPDRALIGDMDALDEELFAGWPRERMWTPDDQQGEHATLRDSVIEDGWPVLGQLRGKAIFVLLDSGEAREEYTEGLTTVAGRAMFPRVDFDHPLAAVFTLDDPSGDADDIALAVDAGFLVRTRSDAGGAPEGGDTSRLEAALASGAHFLSTDFPVEDEETGYLATIPGGTPVGCNPRTAPGDCTPESLEDPAFMD